MESEIISFNEFRLRVIKVNTLIAGSGAASLNAAVSLHSLGQEDLVIATSEWGGGTSNNAGSDKQTYYKLSISGDKPDSVAEMATDLFNGKCMHGDIALCEAQGSVMAFMNLVHLGVKFPHDRYGSWAGYKTDNDPRARGTSAGPYTSKEMFNALAADVKKRRIKVLNRHHLIALITDNDQTRVTGALAINRGQRDMQQAFVLFNCENIILGTGGPAGIYETSVYPESQSGSTGMAFRAGATGQNLTESQFGLASVKFRWNLSGSYQQAMPAYFSTDKNGNNRHDFLNDIFPDYYSMLKAIFLKGYQWPFDPRKTDNYGSSLVDTAVFREINEKGRRVFLDYSVNPSYMGNTEIDFNELDPEVFAYLDNSGALKQNPLERLLALNRPAYDLYLEHGIDIAKEKLEIAVCVQHNNGGLKGDIWWESDLRHLFPVGEVNGSHGVYRPGGAALNSGQVGSYRAVLRISGCYKESGMTTDTFIASFHEQIDRELSFARRLILKGHNREYSVSLAAIRKRMSASAGIIRDLETVIAAASEAWKLYEELPGKLGAANTRELYRSFEVMDHCLSHLIYLEAIKEYLSGGGRGRGSYFVTDPPGSPVEIYKGKVQGVAMCQYDREIENDILEISYKKNKLSCSLVRPRGIPVQDLWFEKVWKEYIEDSSRRC